MSIENQLISYLHHAYGQKELWAGTDETTTQTTELALVRKHVVHGSIPIDTTAALALPNGVDSATGYYVFWFDVAELGTMATVITDDWVSGAALLQHRTDARVFNESGHVIPLTGTYYYRVYDRIVVAIDETVFTAVCDSLTTTTLSISMEHTNAAIGCYYRRITTVSDRSIAFNKAAVASSVFINGVFTLVESVGDIPLSAVFEALTYSDAFESISIAGSELVSYTSEEHEEDVYVLHVPKSSNPEFYLIPSECCELYASAASGGYWMDVVHTGGYHQLTHADFGLLSSVADAAALALGEDLANVTFTLIPRRRTSDKKLVMDANYIRLLYIHDDSDIVAFLTETAAPEEIAFWSANSLDQASFVSDINGRLTAVADESLENYVARYGFFETVNKVCRRVQSFSVGASSQHVFNVRIPPMFNEAFVVAHVFLNGVKLADDLVTFSPLMILKHAIGNEYAADGHCGTIIVDNSVDFTPASGENVSSLVVELFEDPDLETMVVEAPDGTLAVPFDPDYYEVYRVDSVAVPDSEAMVDETFLTKYVAVEADAVGTVEDNELLFDASANTYLVQSKVNMFRIGVEFNSLPEELDPDVGGEMGWFDPIVVNCIDNEGVPIVNVNSALVYLNGRTLIYGVDYILRHQFEGADWVMTQIIVQNAGYVEDTNTLSVYASKDRILFNTNGFSIPELPFGVIDGFGCYENLSIYAVNGYAMNTAILPGWIPGDGAVNTTYAPATGRLCGFRSVLPNLFYEYLDGLTSSADTDLNRLNALKEYFNGYVDFTNDTIYIPESHKLYSLFVMYVVREVLRGNITVPADYTQADLAGLVADYLWLQDLDIVLDGTSSLNYNFIDVYPSYTRAVNDDIKVYQFCQDLMRTYIDADAVTHGDLVPLTLS